MIKELLQKFPILDGGVALIILFALQIFSSGENMLNEYIIKSGWCNKGDIFCLFAEYILIIVVIAITSLVFQLGMDWFYKKNYFEKKEEEISSTKIDINVSKYNFPSFLQATKAGITIKNNNDYDLSLKARIITNIRFTEFFTDGKERTTFFSLDKNNRIIGNTATIIDTKDAGEIIFVEVEHNENVSLLLKKHLLLKSFYSVKSGDYEVNQARWDFVFEIYGTIKNEPFKSEQFSVSMEAFLQSYGEVNAHISEIQPYPSAKRKSKIY